MTVSAFAGAASHGVEAQRTRAALSAGQLAIAVVLLALGVALLVLGADGGVLSLQATAIGALSLQLVATICVIQASHPRLSISSAFAVAWLIYFPLRLLVIVTRGPSPYDFAPVQSASSQQLAAAADVTSAALVAFLIGQLVAGRVARPMRSLGRVSLAYAEYMAIGALGLGVKTALMLLHGSSGLLSNVGDVVLFAIAGAAYLEVREKGHFQASLLLVGAASVFGYLNGFKLLVLMPVAAWVIGRAAAGSRLQIKHLLVAAAATVVAFGIIQGERDSQFAGRPMSDPITAFQTGLTQYDLAHGEPAHYQGIGIAANVIGGLLYRLKGADYYLAIAAKVPSSVPYQAGRSLWQPALSILPGAKQFAGLDPWYRQLSLMTLADNEFILPQPIANPVAESMTEPGDLYLNFGAGGVIAGMLVVGGLYGGFDRLFPLGGPLSAAIVAFAGLPLVEMDTNLAYTIVTSAIRIGIAFLLIAWLSRHSRQTGLAAPGPAAGADRPPRVNR